VLGKNRICHWCDLEGREFQMTSMVTAKYPTLNTVLVCHRTSISPSADLKTDTDRPADRETVDSLVLFLNAASRVRLLYCCLKILLQAWRVIPTHTQQIISISSRISSNISCVQADCQYNIYTQNRFTGHSPMLTCCQPVVTRSLVKCLGSLNETTMSKHWR